MNHLQTKLEALKQEGQYRQLRSITNEGRFLHYEGWRYLNVTSNDYLGISSNTILQELFFEQMESERSHLLGSTSSRLLTGNFNAFSQLECQMATLFNREACLVFNSGYHANLGILPALAGKRDLVIADKFVHASIIDGMRLCESKFERYQHNNLDHLEQILERNRALYENIYIVTESVFSMDGDCADLVALSDLKERYGAFLYVDEAHAFGVYGNSGFGLCEATNTTHRIDLIVGTFGKAISSQGAYLVCDAVVKEYLINTMRPLIFSTAIAPINVFWSSFVVERLAQFTQERQRLIEMSNLFRDGLKERGFITKGSSQIVPLICGENSKAVELSEKIKDQGFWALPVRYPTVPKGEARIRFSLRPDITNDEVDALLKAVEI